MIRVRAATLGEALEQAARALGDAGVPGARGDARLLVALAAGVGREVVMGYPERPLPASAVEDLETLLLRRIEREPMSHLLGRREFWSLDFTVTPDTLDPRPDSETVVATALQEVRDRDRALRLLDLGTGTGCLLLSLLSELQAATGLGVDASPSALGVARGNAERLGLGHRAEFRLGNWGRAVEDRFDVIVANPPYIPDADIDRLAPEVALHEPRYALSGGADGLDAYRALLPDIPRLLARDALLVLEIGDGQTATVSGLVAEAGLRVSAVGIDLGGVERCLAVRAR